MDRAASCSILIVGGGVFGLSTALSLAQGRFKSHPEDLLVLGQSESIPSHPMHDNRLLIGLWYDVVQ